MDTLKINGKDYKFKITWGRFEKSTKKRIKQKDDSENIKFLLNDIWLYLERRWFGLKPFVFKFRLKNKISLQEVKKADRKITTIINEILEDREGKNDL